MQSLLQTFIANGRKRHNGRHGQHYSSAPISSSSTSEGGINHGRSMSAHSNTTSPPPFFASSSTSSTSTSSTSSSSSATTYAPNHIHKNNNHRILQTDKNLPSLPPMDGMVTTGTVSSGTGIATITSRNPNQHAHHQQHNNVNNNHHNNHHNNHNNNNHHSNTINHPPAQHFHTQQHTYQDPFKPRRSIQDSNRAHTEVLAAEQWGIQQANTLRVQQYRVDYDFPRLFVFIPDVISQNSSPSLTGLSSPTSPIPSMISSSTTSAWDSVNPFANTFKIMFVCESSDGYYTRSGYHHNTHHNHHQQQHQQHLHPVIGQYHLHLDKSATGFPIPDTEEFFENLGQEIRIMLREMVVCTEFMSKDLRGHVERALQILDDMWLWKRSEWRTTRMEVDKVLRNGPRGVEIEDYFRRWWFHPVLYLEEDESVAAVAVHPDGTSRSGGGNGNEEETIVASMNEDFAGMYRVLSPDGSRNEWICKEHYDQEFRTQLSAKLCPSVQHFTEQLASIEVVCKDSYDAHVFCTNLELAPRIQELRLKLDFGVIFQDLWLLQDALSRTTINHLSIEFMSTNQANNSSSGAVVVANGRGGGGGAGGVGNARGKTEKLMGANSREYYPILDMIQHATLRSIHFAHLPVDLWPKPSQHHSFPNLQRICLAPRVVIDSKENREAFIALLEKAPNLLIWDAQDSTRESLTDPALDGDSVLEICNSLIGFPSHFSIRLSGAMVIPPNSYLVLYPHKPFTQKDLPQLYNAFGVAREIMTLYRCTENAFDHETLAVALAAVTRKRSELYALEFNTYHCTDLARQAAVETVSQSPLSKLHIQYSSPGDVSILQAVQWSFLRELDISIPPSKGSAYDSQDEWVAQEILTHWREIRVLDSFAYRDERLELFQEQSEPMWILSILPLLKVTVLKLSFVMTAEHWEQVVIAIDFSRLKQLWLSMVEADKVLDLVLLMNEAAAAGIGRGNNIRGGGAASAEGCLELIRLVNCEISEEQVEKAKVRGVTLVS